MQKEQNMFQLMKQLVKHGRVGVTRGCGSNCPECYGNGTRVYYDNMANTQRVLPCVRRISFNLKEGVEQCK
jgi:hypothetical protein